MVRIAIVIGSTRPGRVGAAVGRWVHELARTRSDAEFELVDLAEVGLPLLDEPVPPLQDRYSKEHTKRWAATVARFDGFVFVTAEYNHGIPAALKNALDFLYKEWNDKAAGFVAYGSMMGARAVEALRLSLAELQVATVRNQVGLSLSTDFEGMQAFKPDPRHEKELHAMLDQLVPWTRALKGVREGKAEGHGAEHTRPPRPGQERHGKGEKVGTQANA
jgi:NAD(P)H-dependent FMN reductase